MTDPISSHYCAIPPGGVTDETVVVEVWFNTPEVPLLEETPRSDFRLEAMFELAADGDVRPNAISVTLRDPGGLTRAEIGRFPWSRWIRVAHAKARSTRFYSEELRAELDASARAAQALEPSSRPGRRGHPDEFYAAIADCYQTHLNAGERNPTARVGEDHSVGRSTAAGWIRKARELGYLPPARRGSAG